MRTEIKAALVLGLFVVLGTVIWGINSGRKAPDVPLDVTADEMKNAPPIDLAPVERRADPSARGETLVRPLTPPAEPAPRAAEPPASGAERDEPRAALTPPTDRGASGLPPLVGANAPTDEAGGAIPPAAAPSDDVPLTPVRAISNPGAAPADEPAADPLASESRDRSAATERATPLATDGRTTADSATYTIRPGDTFISIAREKLGADRYWRAIEAANPGVDPLRLREGQTIRLPSADALSGMAAKPPAGAAVGPAEPRPAPATGAGLTHVVAKGETLTGIARQVLGDETRWLEVYELNRDKLQSPHHIVEGMELRLPEPRPREHG